jgi:RNA polymerase sigma-70 factor, ECF subfamily
MLTREFVLQSDVSCFTPRPIGQAVRPEPCDESGIATRFGAGDPEILGELMRCYDTRLRNYLIRLTRDRDVADDLRQETWLRVMMKGAQFKGNSKFSTWLFQIARNLTIDLGRRRVPANSIHEMEERGEDWQSDLCRQGKSPFDSIAASEQSWLLAKTLKCLKPDIRQILIFRYYGEMSPRQISELLGTSLSTTKSRLYRGLAQLERQVRAIAPRGLGNAPECL